MKCNNCGANKFHRRGKTRSGSQRIVCVNCGHWQTDGPPKVGNPKKRKINCPYCGSERTNSHGIANGKKRQRCKDCKKVWYLKEEEV